MKIKLYFFHWAGGTSLIYRPLSSALSQTKHGEKTKCEEKKDAGTDKDNPSCDRSNKNVTFDFCPIDLPGRLMRPNEEAVTDIQILADVLINEMFPKNNIPGDSNPFVFFGHSMGAMVAFEVTKKLKEYGMRPPLALFVSASRPPSANSLVSFTTKLVSQMSIEEISEYLRSRGSKINFDDLLINDEVSKAFLQSIQADYKCLETYTRNFEKITCPLIAIGGDEDSIVSKSDVDAWNLHSADSCESFLLEGKGHFYLDDQDAIEQVSEIIHTTLAKVSS